MRQIMFFRRQQPKQLTFSDRVSQVRSAGFDVQNSAGKTRATRKGVGADLTEAPGGEAHIETIGIVIGDELGVLVDVGYQKMFQTPSGKLTPARAEHLKELHRFSEDLREALGHTSLYNEGLGSTNELHLYDRVEDRDRGTDKKSWALPRR